MPDVLVRIAIGVGAGAVWVAGLRLFLQSDLPRRKKVRWTALLVLVGIGIGVALPLSQVWSKFLLLIVILPVLGLADVQLLRSGRGVSFWIRACGFEVCTVFGAAAAARFLLDLAGAAASGCHGCTETVAMIRIPSSSTWLTAGIIVGTAVSPGLAQECAPAGVAIQIRASASGSDTVAVRYTVVNNSGESLRWVSIGAGGQERTLAVPAQTPAAMEAPSGWRGIVVYPEETAYIHLWWETVDTRTGIGPRSSASTFALRVAGPNAVRPGLIGTDGRPVQPIDFTRLPFTVGGSQGGCWWGRVTPASQR